MHAKTQPEGDSPNSEWSAESWRSLTALQMPAYPDQDALAAVEERLRAAVSELDVLIDKSSVYAPFAGVITATCYRHERPAVNRLSQSWFFGASGCSNIHHGRQNIDQ